MNKKCRVMGSVVCNVRKAMWSFVNLDVELCNGWFVVNCVLGVVYGSCS